MSERWIWMDGAITHADDTTIPVLSHSLSYATSIYEGIRVYDGHIFELGAHLARLRRSARIFGHVTPPEHVLVEACEALLKHAQQSDAYLKIVTFFDDSDTSYAARQCASRTWIAALPRPVVGACPAYALAFASFRRPAPECHPYHAKTSSTYALSYLSYRSRPDWADDVLFIDTEGDICETSGANIFLIRGRTLYTPPPTRCLDGITRRIVIQRIAPVLSLDVVVGAVPGDTVSQFDEAFVCGTAVEIKRIARIGDVTFAHDALVGAITREYEKIVRPGKQCLPSAGGQGARTRSQALAIACPA